MHRSSMSLRRSCYAALAAGLVSLIASAAPAAANTGYAAHVRAEPGLRGYWRLQDTIRPYTFDWSGSSTAPQLFIGEQVTLRQPSGVADAGDRSFRFLGGVADGLWQSYLGGGQSYDFSGSTPFSLEAWLKPGVTGTTTRRIFSRENAAGGYLVGLRSTGLVFSRYLKAGRFYTWNGHGYAPFDQIADWDTIAAPPLPTDRWSHVVATYDQTTIRLFVNGVLAAQTPSTVLLPPSDYYGIDGASFAIGCGRGNWLEYDGLLDEPAVYLGALAPARILDHYRTGAA